MCRKEVEETELVILQYSVIGKALKYVPILSICLEREQVEVTNFFDGLSETERKSIKDLSCKLVKQINERRNIETKLNLVKHENSILE